MSSATKWGLVSSDRGTGLVRDRDGARVVVAVFDDPTDAREFCVLLDQSALYGGLVDTAPWGPWVWRPPIYAEPERDGLVSFRDIGHMRFSYRTHHAADPIGPGIYRLVVPVPRELTHPQVEAKLERP